MSPRRNRPPRSSPPTEAGRGARAGEPPDVDRARRGVEWRENGWTVRNIPADAAVKTYRCPGCQHEIRPGVAHVVAWPAEDWWRDESDRRHWHTGCWRADAGRSK